ncbi:type II pantothenate kinase [Paenibacillus sp. GD4]|jgi:type II pantothenate kinase|uniref:type II pantothenate kinase n=1 Tax=Paenibacillus sp. GD4 TaxID=3068890 RepID=UPI002796B874|nr:type II pantothenate kinase [Paenibacillus sp. GD4]MDQ1914663.1 type II pantothenate kinase [Paenibacillus sp. GD4]
MNIGIDAGGTLIKIAYRKQDRIEFKSLPVSKLEEVTAWINRLAEAKLCITGGRTAQVKAALHKEASEIVEFEGTVRGAKYLLQSEQIDPGSFILTNVGTGTSIHRVQEQGHARVGGTGVGGGTLMGLSQLLTGITDYEAIVSLAASGDRDRIDLKVRHIYEGTEPPIPGDLTASNFGRLTANVHLLTKEELLSSVVGLVGETVATASVLAAGQCGSSSVVYIGSSFLNNEPLKEVVRYYTDLRGARPIFLDNGQYCGAIGSLLSIN